MGTRREKGDKRTEGGRRVREKRGRKGRHTILNQIKQASTR
jgi:hypothetical protein